MDLVSEGLAVLDRKSKYLNPTQAIYKALQTASAVAKRERAGIFELGDVSPEDD